MEEIQENEKWDKYNKPELSAKQRADHNHYLKVRNLKNDLDGKFTVLNDKVKDLKSEIEVIPEKDNSNKINNEVKKEYKADMPDNKETKKEYNKRVHCNENYNQNMLILGIGLVCLIGGLAYILMKTDVLDNIFK